MISPCKNTCKLDKNSGFCVSCCRTIKEIQQWIRLTDKERIDIMEQLPKRSLDLEQGLMA